MPGIPFRFNAARHEYIAVDTGEVVPSITQLIRAYGIRRGKPDKAERFYTQAGRDRGDAVHKLAADYDLGALDVDEYEGDYRGWLLAYVEAMARLEARVLAVELALCSGTYRFAGRTDRVLQIGGAYGVLELKSGGPKPEHQMQTALQAILQEDAGGLALPAERIERWVLYVKGSGKLRIEQHTDGSDLSRARKAIQEFAR